MNTKYQPEVLVEDIRDITREEWLEMRKKGIGGSDIGGIFGVSPWKTSLDIYYEKTGIATAAQGEKTGIPLEMGTLLEPYIASLYERETGNKILEDHTMYFHPDYPYLLANIDFAVVDKNGRQGNLECKFSSEHNRSKWADGRVPYHYEMQGHEYNLVRNVEFTDFACLFSDYTFIWRHMERDYDFEEQQMIPVLSDFWENHVLKLCPPEPSGSPDLVLQSLKNHLGQEDIFLPELTLSKGVASSTEEILFLKEEKSNLNAQIKELNKQIDRASYPIAKEMGQHSKGKVMIGQKEIVVSFSTVYTRRMDWEKLQTQYPEIYDEVVSKTSSRTLKIKSSEIKT